MNMKVIRSINIEKEVWDNALVKTQELELEMNQTLSLSRIVENFLTLFVEGKINITPIPSLNIIMKEGSDEANQES